MSGEERPLFRGQVLLSFQRALWDAVTPELRGVAVSWSSGDIRARFLFDSIIDEEIRELVSLVETSVVADFYPDASIVFEIEECRFPADRGERGLDWWVYLRKEPSLP